MCSTVRAAQPWPMAALSLPHWALCLCCISVGFALVGGPARQDAPKAVEALTNLNVPYLCSLPLVFQTTEEWMDSELGVHPVQVALQVCVRCMRVYDTMCGAGVVVFGRTEGSFWMTLQGLRQAWVGMADFVV